MELPPLWCLYIYRSHPELTVGVVPPASESVTGEPKTAELDSFVDVFCAVNH